MLHDSLEKHGKRLGFIAPKHPRAIPEQEATPGIRQRVPLGVRRAVLERDGHRCTEICNGDTGASASIGGGPRRVRSARSGGRRRASLFARRSWRRGSMTATSPFRSPSS